MCLLCFVLAACLLLSPSGDHARLAQATRSVLAKAEALPFKQGDPDKRKTAALLVAVAYREGSLKTEVVGDKGESFCTMQIHKSSGGLKELNEDPEKCMDKGLAMLRTSFRVCPEHPIAWYAEGPKGCESERAQRISRDRMSLAGWIVRSLEK